MRKIVAAIAVLAAVGVEAKTVNISRGGNIAAAITEALSDSDPAEVVLGAGDYAPSATISITDAVTVRGATGNRDDIRISGSNARRVFTVNNASAVLRDVTIEGGSVGGNQMGAGVDLTSGMMTNCTVRNCRGTAYGGGGAVRLNSATASIWNSVITNNYWEGGNGGGGDAKGAGLRIDKGVAVGCFIAGNWTSAASKVLGAGVYLASSADAKLVNSTIVNNRGNNSGGVYAEKNSTVANCLIWGNSADGAGGDIANDIYAGTASRFDHCLARRAINANCFAIDDYPRADAWYTPFAATAAHDASTAVSGISLPDVDLLGQSRVAGAAADIGATENPGNAKIVAITASSWELIGTGTIDFTAWTENLAGITAYSWDFGDGASIVTVEPTVQHAYAAAGTFAVQLIVTASDGNHSCTVANVVNVHPETLFVVNNNSGATAPYATIETAAADIPTAFNASVSGQTIVIAPGTYPITANLNLAKAVKLRGSTGNPEDVVITRSSNFQMVRLAAAGAEIDSMTIDGANVGCSGDGALLYIDGNGTATNCVIRNANGNAYSSRGAVYVTGSGSLITHSVISNNVTSGSGYKDTYAGMTLVSSAKCSNSLIAYNTFSAGGDRDVAGVYVNGGMLENCTVVGNVAKKIGGVRCASGSVVNCVIAGNSASDTGDEYSNVNKGDDSRFTNCASDILAIGGTDCRQVSTKESLFVSYANGDFTPAPDLNSLITARPSQDALPRIWPVTNESRVTPSTSVHTKLMQAVFRSD